MTIPCSCIKGHYNAYAEAIDLENIIYQDLSTWMIDSNYVVPDTYEVNVRFPGRRSTVSFSAKTHGSVLVPKDTVGYLLDGIYCFEVESCGIVYKKNIAIFPNLRCCLKQAKIQKWDSHKDEIREIDSIISTVESSIDVGSFESASEGLDIAKSLLDNLNCDCSCYSNK